MEYQYQWNVSAVGQGKYDSASEIFRDDEESKAKALYHEFLVKYPSSEVWIERELRRIGTMYGTFLVSSDGSRAVNEKDNEMQFTLPSTKMSDNSIRKLIYDRIRK